MNPIYQYMTVVAVSVCLCGTMFAEYACVNVFVCVYSDIQLTLSPPIHNPFTHTQTHTISCTYIVYVYLHHSPYSNSNIPIRHNITFALAGSRNVLCWCILCELYSCMRASETVFERIDIGYFESSLTVPHSVEYGVPTHTHIATENATNIPHAGGCMHMCVHAMCVVRDVWANGEFCISLDQWYFRSEWIQTCFAFSSLNARRWNRTLNGCVFFSFLYFVSFSLASACPVSMRFSRIGISNCMQICSLRNRWKLRANWIQMRAIECDTRNTALRNCINIKLFAIDTKDVWSK